MVSESNKRWKLDNKITAMMVEDMMFDPILAAKVLLRVKLPPHEELRLIWMWTTYFTNDDSGFSTGKSWTFALVSALRSMLFPNRVSGIISKTFAQGKLIFGNFDRWYNTSPIFRNCIATAGGKPRLIHGNDSHVAEFIGQAQIRVLPPDFLKDSERIRSERWHDGYFDEWTTYGNFKAFNTTFIGRITNVNEHKKCPVRQNHVHMASTPSYMHHPSYKIIKPINKQIRRGNRNYGRFTSNWRHIQLPEFDSLVNDKIIYHMQTNLPKGAIKSEVDGLWSEDSMSWYNSYYIDCARAFLPTLQMQRNHPDEIFIGGFDTAPGGGDGSARSPDDSSFTVLKLDNPTAVPKHCFTFRATGISDIEFGYKILHWHSLFGFGLIMYDPNGGGLFVKDKLKTTTYMHEGKEHSCLPIVSYNDNSVDNAHQILVAFGRGDSAIDQCLGKMGSDSVLVNRMHKELKGAIENKNIALAQGWNGWDQGDKNFDVDGLKDFLNRSRETLTLEEHTKAEMDLAVLQLMKIDPERDKETNELKVDSFNMYKFKSKQKKDSAYGLCYAHFGVAIWKKMFEEGILVNSTSGEESFFAHGQEINQ